MADAASNDQRDGRKCYEEGTEIIVKNEQPQLGDAEITDEVKRVY